MSIENSVADKKLKNNEAFLENFIPYAMYRITNHLNTELQNDLRPLKINVSRWRVLAALHAVDGRTMGGLCTYTMIAQSALTRVIDNMEKEKLVSRCLQENDNRHILVHLTDKGREKFEHIYPKVLSRQDRVLIDFSNSEHEQLLVYFRRIEKNLNISNA